MREPKTVEIFQLDPPDDKHLAEHEMNWVRSQMARQHSFAIAVIANWPGTLIAVLGLLFTLFSLWHQFH